MFVRSRGLLAASVAVLGAAAACSDPNLPTDLRPDGPPEVLAVLLPADTEGVVEQATFCKTQGPNDGAAGVGDDKRPSTVDTPGAAGGAIQICPDDITMGVDEFTETPPTAWYVRVMFDELLDGDAVEDLIPVGSGSNFAGSLERTQPVTLTCNGVTIPYGAGSYYQPAGNAFTAPVGPSFYITPDDPTSVPTGAECTITINDVVVDKDGNEVPADQRGPYTFAISGLSVSSISPTPGVTDAGDRDTITPTTPITISFNDLVDPASITAGDFQLFKGVGSDCTGGTAVAAGVFQGDDEDGNVVDPTSVEVYDTTATGVNPDPSDPDGSGNLFEPSTAYRLEIPAGASASDIAGGSGDITFPPDDDGNAVTELCFDVSAAM